MSLPQTSLILCSRNRPALLAESVNSILAGDSVPTELLIVDQSDVPHPALQTLTSDRPCDIRYIWTQTVGLSRANNLGIAAAHFDWLIFTHDDVVAPPAWFETIVRAAVAAGPRGVVTGQVRPGKAAGPDGFAPTIKVDAFAASYSGRLDTDVLYPLNMAMHRSAFAEVGGFDERLGPGTPFPGAEDNDLGFRLLEAGYCIQYVPEAALCHQAWRSERDYLPLRWSYGLAMGAYYAKYLSLSDRHMLGRMRADLGRHAGYLARYGLRRSRRQNYADVTYMLGLLSGAARWLLTQPKAP